MKSTTTTVLDKISGYLFLAGFISTKLKNIPITIVAVALNIVSLFSYLIGYVAWYLAASLYPNYPRKNDTWYGFAEFKNQYQIAALLGTIAAITTIACILVPPLILPTAWLYTLSNLVWSISEHHKKENPPPDDEQYSGLRQALYLRYALLVTSSSALAAITTTATFLFPPAALIIITTSTIIGIGLTIASLYYWAKCAFGTYPPDNVNHSYNQFSRQLSFTLNNEPEPDKVCMPNMTHEKSNPSTVHMQHDVDGYEDPNSVSIMACH